MKTQDGRNVAPLGMGAWSIGDRDVDRKQEIACFHEGLDAGLSLIDTAEMYGNGRSESLIGEALEQRRQSAFLVSKVLPSHATFEGTQRHCRASLERLRTDYLDLYLLHWRGHIPLEETVEGLEKLRKDGLIRYWGGSNFDTDDIQDVLSISQQCRFNQILYNVKDRGPEFDLIPRHDSQGVISMAYSPLGHDGQLLQHPVLRKVASHYETTDGPATSAQIALAWVMRRGNMMTIPKTSSSAHLRENLHARDLTLTEASLQELDKTFRPPKQKTSLEMI